VSAKAVKDSKKKATPEQQKKAAALAAMKFVQDGMKIGLGTGSTAKYFIEALAEKVKAGLKVECVPTSKATFELAKSLGIPLKDLHQLPRLDYTFDGADEFDPQFNLIKGGGGALLIEKMVASSSRIMVTMADESKQVQKLGAFPLPVEVVRLGVNATVWKMQMAFEAVGIKAPKISLRVKDGKPFITDMGNLILDCACGVIEKPDNLDIYLNNIPGVVNNGLFIRLSGIIFVGRADGSVEELRRGG
jgi:ribose 5-phosphate isomerase A